VYFYPKDNTPGCTREAQDFRDLYTRFRRRNCGIIGVSRDSAASHTRFRDKLDAPFPLVADEGEQWCRAFEVIGEKMLYGKRHVGVIRSTFLIGPGSILVAEWRKVKVPGHAQAVLDRLGASAGAG
jgi:peroxiredoxin Q/BCP